MGKIRGTHSSPGIYTQITDLSYAARNLGITSLGLVGETLYGPAFEPIKVSNWDEYVTYFGGTSAEKFKDSQYPKYELPYIAQSYLKASDRLSVCRVLGLSGYNAGSAFVITAEGDEGKKYVVAVLRSRGKYTKYSTADVDEHNCPVTTYDTLVYDCDEIELGPYNGIAFDYDCNGYSGVTDDISFDVDAINRGHFTIIAKKKGEEIASYSVSLNPGAKDYIYNVLGSNPTEGSAAVFVEELYDVMLDGLIADGKVDKISSSVIKYDYKIKKAIADPVGDFVTVPAEELTKKMLGRRFIFSAAQYIPAQDESAATTTTCIVTNDSGKTVETNMKEGDVVLVKQVIKDGIKKYIYARETELTESSVAGEENVVKVLAYDAFVKMSGDTIAFTNDFYEYREQFRYATTPWVVSELKGSAEKVEVKKLFRFHTITDGNYANSQVKISIANIRPDEGTFDVYVRDFYDTDSNPTILESYKNVNMLPGSSKYIGLKIGTFNGDYELKSKYVMVEVIENEMTEACVPAGFLGYPVRYYTQGEEKPFFTYNRYYDPEVKERRQYFGLSDISGIDVDMLSYKGKDAYSERYDSGYTNGFHLDSRLSWISSGNVLVDNEKYDMAWDAVSPDNITTAEMAPVIGSEEEMQGTIYEDVRLRKFTLCPCGGFDGWDIYRRSRTNTNEFKANKYKGTVSHGEGATFSVITNGEGLALSGRCITSDYYAYLAGINQFENPEKEEINLFATPGIDYVNNEFLVNDAIDMVEGRLDTLYVITTPDKPFGASDAVDEMYTSREAAGNLSDTNVDTYYGATYYPWVKYFDRANNIYINLPATKDAVRIMANTDNKRYPWIAPAGMERGTVECQKLHFPAKLEDRDNVYDNRINALISFSQDGVKLWGNKTLYICDDTDPMNRINTVRLVLYMRKLLIESVRGLIFEPNDATLREEFEGIVKPILSQIKADRGITDYRLETSQTKEQMDMHEMSAKIWIKPTPALEAIELEFVVTPQGIEFDVI